MKALRLAGAFFLLLFLGFGAGAYWYSFTSWGIPDGVEYKLLRCETRKGKVETQLYRCQTDCARCSGQWEPSMFFGVRSGDSTR